MDMRIAYESLIRPREANSEPHGKLSIPPMTCNADHILAYRLDTPCRTLLLSHSLIGRSAIDMEALDPRYQRSYAFEMSEWDADLGGEVG